jgi:hypothetical protein
VHDPVEERRDDHDVAEYGKEPPNS